MIEMSEEERELHRETAKALKGSDRRIYMARVVKKLGWGGKAFVWRNFGWAKETVNKGIHELESGIRIIDNFSARGRKPSEHHLPNLLDDIQSIVDSQSQTDPTFQTTRLFTRLTAAEVRKQLLEQKQYTDEQLPCERTIREKLNQLGYRLRKVKKSQPKKIPETDAIFQQLDALQLGLEEDKKFLRISMDAKASVPIGEFSRGGSSRVEVDALDHDFKPEQKVTPFGFFLPEYDRLYIYILTSKVTSDAIVDCLTDLWQKLRPDFPEVETLMLNLDNGPENHSRRTQFMCRLTEFVEQEEVDVNLNYYPPYHSKYNPVERVWGVLEQHWNGSLLDSVEAVVEFVKSMTYKGTTPVVSLVEKVYETGVKLTKKAMAQLEQRFNRLPGLEKWFVIIPFLPVEV